MSRSKRASRLSSDAHETIESVADLERGADERRSTHQRWIERTTAAVGRPRSVYFTLGFVAVWVAGNSALALHGKAFDPPPFSYLECTNSWGNALIVCHVRPHCVRKVPGMQECRAG